MGFFDNFGKKDEWVVYGSRLAKAEEIVNRLGEEKFGRNYLGTKIGHMCTDKVYEGYGLKIVKEEKGYTYEKDVYVKYKDKRVLGYNTYVPGPWEEILKELYKSIDAILDERTKRENLIKKKESIYFAILDITGREGQVDIGNGIVVGSAAWWSGSYDQNYEGSSSSVYDNGKLVFQKSMMSDDRHSGDPYITYIPGPWEDKVKQYAKYAKKARQQDQAQKYYEEMMEEVKKLRKLRGEN